MIKKAGIVLISVFSVFFLIAVTLPLKNKFAPQNNRPVVKIITPKNKSGFDSNTKVNYSIIVSDKEDGESRYDEINTKEVLLQVKYVSNESKTMKEVSQGIQNDPPGLAAIRTSNCLNCHAFNTKVIGPSFYEIDKKYPATSANIALMVKRIREGSSGVWDKTPMPTHSELTKQETQNMVQWILQNASDPTTSYYTGTEGVFRIESNSLPHKNGAYMLTASYTDHGVKEDSIHRLKGQDVVVIYSR